LGVELAAAGILSPARRHGKADIQLAGAPSRPTFSGVLHLNALTTTPASPGASV
jgi:hypothetical protein